MKQPKSNFHRITYAYCRVSSEDQVTHGVSMEAQAERLEAYVVATGRANVVMVLDPGESAKSLRRPGMERILADIRAGLVEAVMVLKLDRLTRSVRDLSALLDLLEKHDTALVSVTESMDTSTAAGRMVIKMLAVVSEWEREAIGERTSFALSHKRRNGAVYGPVPFGYRRDGDALVPLPNALAIVDTVRAMRDAGTSLRKCGAHLEAHGFMAPRGGSWSAQGVKEMLESKVRTAA